MRVDYRPFRLDHPAALELGDLRLVEHDLAHVRECVAERLNLNLAAMNAFVICRALTTSALIAYRRCFNSSVRWGLASDEVKSALGDEWYLKHQRYWSLASEGFAHTTVDLDRGIAGVSIGFCEDGSKQI